MPTQVTLPSDEDLLSSLINEHFDGEQLRLLPIATMYRLVWLYLSGSRRFDIFNLTTGQVTGHTVDQEGRLEYQGGELLRAIDQLSSYLTSYDLSPKISGEGHSLGAVRDGAIGQAIASSIFSNDEIEHKAPLFAHNLTALGSCGAAVHVDDPEIESIGLTADIEIVHPLEIVPFPHLNMDLSKQRGIGRQYWVPLEQLEKVRPKSWITKNLEQFYYGRFRHDQDPSAIDPLAPSQSISSGLLSEVLSATGGGPRSTSKPRAVAEDQIFVRLRELWLDGPRGTCTRKVCVSGRKVIQDNDFNGIEAYCPLIHNRFMENGTFHGAGLFHILYSISRNIERINKSLFQEVVDRERHGYLVLPQGSFNANTTAREIGVGLKLLGVEADQLTDSGFRPFLVQPNNVGDSNTKVAVYARQLFDNTNPLVDIVREKGRIDSERGLAFLQEQIDRAMTSPTRGLLHTFGRLYKAGLSQASVKISNTNRPIPISRLTLDLVGAVVDWDTGTIRFAENPLPSISRLRCRPMMSGQRSKAQRKMEAIELLKLGISDRYKFLIKSIEEGWDLAMWTATDESAISTIIRDCITLYGDGITPGQVVAHPHFAKPEIQLLYLDTLMGSPKMSSASPEVQSEFIRYRKFLIENMGRALPEGLPYNPDDVAVAQQGAGQAMNSMLAGMQPAMMSGAPR